MRIQVDSVHVAERFWMIKNLDVSRFRDGSVIPMAPNDDIWKWACENGIPAWCYYDYNEANGLKYGKLYNWFAVKDYRGLAPLGWSIPTIGEWNLLNAALNYQQNTNKNGLSEKWLKFDDEGRNPSGLKISRGGYRDENGVFRGLGKHCRYWTSSIWIKKGPYYVSICSCKSEHTTRLFGSVGLDRVGYHACSVLCIF